MRKTKTYKALFDEFMLQCPWLADKVSDWYDAGYFLVRVEFEDGTAGEYDGIDRCFAVRQSIEALDDMHRGNTEEKWRIEFSIRLNREMKRAGYDQCSLAEDTGLTQGVITKYVNGLRIPSSYNLKKIATALGISTDDLINF